MKFKHKYNIGKTLSLAGLMMLANACNKERDVIIDWEWGSGLDATTQKEIIRKEINKKNVNMIFLDFGEQNLTDWYPAAFHRARDTLQTCLDMAPGRIHGMGTIYVSSQDGAHLPDVTARFPCGMGSEDSLWYTANGWKVQRLHPEWIK